MLIYHETMKTAWKCKDSEESTTDLWMNEAKCKIRLVFISYHVLNTGKHFP